jgi:tetratricopeptide (TPR) repeat protein
MPGTNEPENAGGGLLAALHRLSLTAAVFSLLAIPGFFALHFAGPWAALAAWIATYLLCAWSISRNLRRFEQRLMEALCAPVADLSGQPTFPLMLIGLVFVAGGIAVWMSDAQHPKKGEPMPPTAQIAFGAIFVGTGSGIFGIGATAGLIRLAFRRQLAKIDDRIAWQPDCADARLERAALLSANNRSADAIDAFGEAIRVAPDKAEAYVRRGELYYYDNRNEEAIADLTRAIEIESDNAEAYTLRSLAYEGNHQPELAEADERRAAEIYGTIEDPDAEQPS